MSDSYKVRVIREHMAQMQKDEYYTAQLKGSAAKPINLDMGALKLLEEYYETSAVGGGLTPPAAYIRKEWIR